MSFLREKCKNENSGEFLDFCEFTLYMISKISKKIAKIISFGSKLKFRKFSKFSPTIYIWKKTCFMWLGTHSSSNIFFKQMFDNGL